MPDDRSPRYQIVIDSAIDPDWSDWLGALQIRARCAPDGRAQTVLTGRVADQAALRGILNRLWDLNLQVVSLKQLRE
jgi:hypothetical protein